MSNSKSKGNNKNNRRSPAGMTTKKATAKAKKSRSPAGMTTKKATAKAKKKQIPRGDDNYIISI